MTKQRVLWTACPHGKAKDGKLRVSVHVAPQLFPTGNAVSSLAEFSDWQYWPATNVRFKVKIGPRTFDADIVSAPPSSSLWHALFPSSTTVDPYEYSSPTSSPLHSYPAGFVRHFFQSTYADSRTRHPSAIGLVSSSSRVRTASVPCRSTAGSSTTGSRP